MNFSYHAKVGFYTSCVAASVGYLFKDMRTAILAGILCFVGSIIPDLDTDSIPSRWTAKFGAALTFICIYLAREYPEEAASYYFPAAVAALLFFTIKAFPHRSFTHSYFGPLLSVGIGIFHGNLLYVVFGIGLACHLIVDSLSPLDSRNWL